MISLDCKIVLTIIIIFNDFIILIIFMGHFGRSSSDFFGFHWISSDFIGFLQISLDFFRFHWISKDFRGFLVVVYEISTRCGPLDAYVFWISGCF